MPTSNRTWSLPLPVQPWATVSAPNCCAAATRCLTITGRDSADTSGYLSLYSALALQRGQAVVVGELVLGVDDDRLDRAARQSALAHDVHVLAALADVDRDGDDLGPVSSRSSRRHTEVSRPPE